MVYNRTDETPTVARRCKIFNCDNRRGNFCCAECGRKRTCKNLCLNNPNQCGQVSTKPMKSGV